MGSRSRSRRSPLQCIDPGQTPWKAGQPKTSARGAQEEQRRRSSRAPLYVPDARTSLAKGCRAPRCSSVLASRSGRAEQLLRVFWTTAGRFLHLISPQSGPGPRCGSERRVATPVVPSRMRRRSTMLHEQVGLTRCYIRRHDRRKGLWPHHLHPSLSLLPPPLRCASRRSSPSPFSPYRRLRLFPASHFAATIETMVSAASVQLNASHSTATMASAM